MGFLSALLLLTALDAVPVEVGNLAGEEFRGRLQSLTEREIVLETEQGTRRVPVSELMQVRFAEAASAAPEQRPPFEVRLVDGSVLHCTEVGSANERLSVAVPGLGQFAVPITAVASIRLGAADAAVDDAWDALHERDVRDDMLVVRKGDVLDHLAGVVGDIDEKAIKFLLDGDTIPVNRQKAFGVIYFRRNSEFGEPVCRIELTGADSVQAKAVTLDQGRLRATLLAGSEVTVPLDRIRTLDFSLGKVQYLSQMEPREVSYTPFFDVTWKYRRDQNLDGGPIRLGSTTYARGLCIHSRTLLKYRIGGEYRRFRAVMGIDQAVAGKGDVHVVISGDGKPLLEADVRGSDEPQPIDLDVRGVRDLEILVDFGGDLDIADHLDLADAKVIK